MTAKVGRNDPCPCGSGKKYKNAVSQIDRHSFTGRLRFWGRLYRPRALRCGVVEGRSYARHDIEMADKPINLDAARGSDSGPHDQKTERPTLWASPKLLVAGAGFEPATFRL